MEELFESGEYKVKIQSTTSGLLEGITGSLVVDSPKLTLTEEREL